jgi:tight adherence protein B
VTEGWKKGVRTGVAALLAALILLLTVGASPALTQGENGAAVPELLLVDATGEPFVVIRTATEPGRVAITTGGVPADTASPVALSDASLQVQTAIVIDNSAESSDFLDTFKTIARDYVREAPPDERIEVWTTGGEGRIRVGFGSPETRTLRVIDSLVPAAGSNRLWDAVRGVSLRFDEPVPGATNIIVLTANVDGGSENSEALARGSVLGSGAGVFMVHAGQTTSSAESLLVSVSAGGSYALETDRAVLAGFGLRLSNAIQSTWAVYFNGDAVPMSTSIAADVDGYLIRGSYVSGSVAAGSALAVVTPPASTTLPGLGFLDGEMGRRVGLGLGALAAALGAYSTASLFGKDTSELDDVLQAYGSPLGAQAAEADSEKRSFAKNLFVKRAVELTEGIAKQQGGFERAEAMLERAEVPLRAGEAFTAYIGIVLSSLVLGLLLVGGISGLLVMGLLGVLAPPAVLNFRATQRKKKFAAQLPDTLFLLSSTLKAGYSFMQGVEAVSQEIEDPMGVELRRIVTEAQLGRPLEDAMDAAAVRMDSDDFAWAVMAVKIQREVGGNLSELLTTVGNTMTARERMRRDIASLTAEGKMSAILLGGLPPILGAVMWVMNPDYIGVLFNDTLGNILLGTSLVAVIIGFAWMKKMIDIEI